MSDKFLPLEVVAPNKDNGVFIRNDKGETVCDLYYTDPHDGEIISFDNADEYAAFIVTCVNSHSALVDALEVYQSIIPALRDISPLIAEQISLVYAKADVALKLAKGE